MTIGDFTAFWSAYPRRIAKGAARIAFEKALRKTTLETMLAAIEKYKRHKPDTIDYCHPATWLNGERWEDEWEAPETIKPQPLFRPARTVDEVKEYLRSLGRPLSSEVRRAKSVEDLPAFSRMIPADWQPANVTQLRRA